MKYDKWTVGLAAVGLVSLTTAVQAEEKPANSVMTALSSTTISGYVDTSAQWNFGTGNTFMPPYKFGGTSKADGFNLDVVQIRIEKPMEAETQWASGYRVDLWAGPDANVLGTQSTLSTGSSDFAIRQAYVGLRVPIGTGLDFKLGVFDSVLGYESVESPANPNYTRSYGHSIEPQTHTGILGTYHFCECFSASFGVANTIGPSINSRAQAGSAGGTVGGIVGNFFPGATSPFATGSNPYPESFKTYMGSVALTAPESWGWMSGSTLYGGVVNGYNNSLAGSGAGLNQLSAYAGVTMPTPVKDLRVGAAFDILDVRTYFQGTAFGATQDQHVDGEAWTVAGYTTWAPSNMEKLKIHGRVEYAEARVDDPNVGGIFGRNSVKILAVTGTLEYDLWKNVLSRLELRWDHSLIGTPLFGSADPNTGGPSLDNAWMLAANVIYKF